MNRPLRAATIGVLLIAPVALSSCSAGQIPQTSTQNRDKVGAGATIGAIALREVKLPFPTGGTYSQGGDAELSAAIVNGGSEPDTLVGVTGNDFSGVRTAGTGSSPLSSSAASSTSSALTSVPGTPVGTVPPGGVSAPTSGSSSSSSSAASSSSATPSSAGSAAGPTTAATGIAGATGTPSAAPTSSSSAGSGVSLTVPADTTLYLGGNSPHVFLTGLTRSLTAGQTVRITFQFQKAGSVSVDAFVASPVSYVPNSSSYDFTVPTKASEPGVEGGGAGESAGGNG